jgi:uncharacterized tellurite resistance protein B-like protein
MIERFTKGFAEEPLQNRTANREESNMAGAAGREGVIEIYANFLYLYMLVCVADGECAEVETDTAFTCLKEWWDSDPSSDPSVLVEALERAKGWTDQGEFSTEKITQAAKLLMDSNANNREAFLNDLVRIAGADGSIHGNEKMCCNMLADVWRLRRPFEAE